MTEALFDPDVESLAARIPDGAKLAIIKSESGAAMAATRALIRRRVKNLDVLTVPTSGLQADLLIGAGCVKSIETSGVTMGELGQAPCFGRAVREGAVEVRDSTCPAVYAGLQAAEKGIPFMPIRGLIGSDVARGAGFTAIDNPFAADDPIVAVRALRPDFALFHAPLADRRGNVWIGRHRGLMIMAHACRETLATVEELYDGDLMEDERYAPATISALYVSAIAVAAKGAWPLALPGRYDEDAAHLAEYCRLAATAQGFASYLAEHVVKTRAAAE